LIIGQGEPCKITIATGSVPYLVDGAVGDREARVVDKASVCLRTNADSQSIVNGPLRAGYGSLKSAYATEEVIVGKANAGCSIKILIQALALSVSASIASIVVVSIVSSIAGVGNSIEMRRNIGSGYTSIVDQ